VRLLSATLLLGLFTTTTACGGGGGGNPGSQSNALSGNWQISLNPQAKPIPAFVYTGFLLQSGNSVTGSLILGSDCRGVGPISQGVGPVTGTVNGQNVSLTIDEFEDNINLTGTLSSGSAPLGGQFSNAAGRCTASANTGTWSAIQVAPVAGKFHGTFKSNLGNGNFDVNGTLNQGPNTGNSTATLSGTINATGAARVCSYISSATITGLVSGTAVTLNLYGPDGAQFAQLGQFVNAAGNSPPVTITLDATSLSGTYNFPKIQISSPCPADQGMFQLSFP
jgi:hypothetical protein